MTSEDTHQVRPGRPTEAYADRLVDTAGQLADHLAAVRYDDPAKAHAVLVRLTKAAELVGDATATTGRWLTDQQRAGRLVGDGEDDGGDPVGACAAALAEATAAARGLVERLDRAAAHAGHLVGQA